MTRTKTKNKYYSLDKILEYNATYNMVVGERSNGKTYAVLKYAIDDYFNGSGGELALVRRWDEDIRPNKANQMFNAHIENDVIAELSEGEYTGITYSAGKFYFCNYDEDDGRPIYNDNDVFGYTFAVSQGEHYKSLSYPNINTILFDEFMTKGTTLKDEFTLFMNIVSTIVRRRDNVKIFMLGNTVNKYSPYFKEMGLTNMSDMIQGTIDLYTYGDSELSVAVEYPKSNGESKPSDKYFAFDNPKLKMITSGAWELDIYPHLPVKYVPKDVELTYFIKFDDSVFQCEIIEAEGELFTYIHEKTTPIKNENEDIVYSLEYSHRHNYSRSIYKATHRFGKIIASFFHTDKVFYQDNHVGNAISNYLELASKL